MSRFCSVIYIKPTTIQTYSILQALFQQSLLTCLLWRCKVHLCLNKDRNCFCADRKVKKIGCLKFYVYKKQWEKLPEMFYIFKMLFAQFDLYLKSTLLWAKSCQKCPMYQMWYKKYLTNKMIFFFKADYVKRFYKHLSSKKFEISGNCLMCQALHSTFWCVTPSWLSPVLRHTVVDHCSVLSQWQIIQQRCGHGWKRYLFGRGNNHHSFSRNVKVIL